ncbi:MAG TPA: IclR family transcriptional regulator [Caulobacteraceae bacterium]
MKRPSPASSSTRDAKGPRPLPSPETESGGKGERDQGVQVLARAAEMLRLLKVNPAGLTQAEIAGHLGLARTTVHRILNALADEGLVEPSGSGSRHRLGHEIIYMAEAVRSGLVTEIHPLLQNLSDEIHETVDLSVLERAQLTFIDQVVAPQRLRLVGVIGANFPLYCTANGKAILASLPPRTLDRMLPSRLEALTPNTITSPDALRRELDQVRKRGVAIDREEHSEGICAVGVALLGSPLGQAALSVPIPAQRFEEKREIAIEALLRTAKLADAIWRGDA